MSTPLAPELYNVVSRNDSSIVIKSLEGVQYERNKAHLKTYLADAVDTGLSVDAPFCFSFLGGKWDTILYAHFRLLFVDGLGI